MKSLRLLSFLCLIGCGDADLVKSVKAVDGTNGKDGKSCDLIDTGAGSMVLVCGGQSVLIEKTSACTYVINTDKTVTLSCPGTSPLNVALTGGLSPAQSSPSTSASSCGLEQGANGCIYSVCNNNSQLVWGQK